MEYVESGKRLPLKVSCCTKVMFTGACDASFPTMTNLLTSLAAAGVATIVASGNDGETNRMPWPACVSPADSP